MVCLRGIDISIVSSFDIQKLPEFPFYRVSPLPGLFDEHTNDPSTAETATVSCYVPIYHGSQIWFEYTIEGPHPHGAAYLFKLFLDGKHITSWDCTEKHSYHGKMMYNLVCGGKDEETDTWQVHRQAMTFTPDLDVEPRMHQYKNVIELRVYRIERRRRIREIDHRFGHVGSKNEHIIQFTNGGYLEPGFPRRLWEFQLLDRIDEPYATFRFFCRSTAFLDRYGITPSLSTDASSAIPEQQHDGYAPESTTDSVTKSQQSEALSASTSPSTKHTTAQRSYDAIIESWRDEEHPWDNGTRDYASNLSLSNSDESLSIIAKDSVENLHSTIPRSPRLKREPSPNDQKDLKDNTMPMLSPGRRLKKKLTIRWEGTEFDVGRKQRPLSPFTNAGTLRKRIPPSAPPTMTEFGPSINEELRTGRNENKRSISSEAMPKKTTRGERGGRNLIGLLGRRFASN